MEFLLTHTRLFFFSFGTLFVQALFMLVAFYFARAFIEVEKKKLKEHSNHFDLGLILAFGIVFSVAVSFVGTIIVSSVAKYYFDNLEYLYRSYFELLIVFLAILLTSSILFVNPKEHLRFKSLTHADSRNAHRTFMRIVLTSLVITTISYAIANTLLGTKYILICEYCVIGLIIAYCLVEITAADYLISKILRLRKTKSVSTAQKVVAFFNTKFQYVILFCMVYAVEPDTGQQLSGTEIFTHINDVYLFLVVTIAFQCIAVAIANKFSVYIDSLDDGSRSEHLVQSRSDNLTYICNFIIFAIYFAAISIVLQYSGIDVRTYVMNEYFAVVIFGSFITFMLCRAFNELRDTILEKAEKGDHEHYLMLKTFAPTLSVVFYAVLLLTAVLIILTNIGVDVTPIVASFSIFGAALALASQGIIKAFLYGLTLLIEKNLYVGDYIDINGKSGTIEKLSVRVLYLRSFDGCVHVIPYDEISTITNHSKGYTRHTESLRLMSQDDIDKASRILTEIVDEMRKEPQYKGKIFGSATILGLEPFDLTGIKIKWEVVTHPTSIHITDDIYRRLAERLKKAGVKIPEMAQNISING